MKSMKTIKACILIIAILALTAITTIHVHTVSKLQDSPFDHLLPNLVSPFYHLHCLRNQNVTTNHCELPTIFMLKSRPLEMRLKSNASWSKHDINSINSSSLEPDVWPCGQTAPFKTRLFHIYQIMFAQILATSAQPGPFIFLEDDSVLKDDEVFHRQACAAIHRNLDFYSFYSTGSGSCLYSYGTSAFIMTRSMMAKVVGVEDASVRCRLPIDMYLSSIGPWYAAVEESVLHHSARFKSIGWL